MSADDYKFRALLGRVIVDVWGSDEIAARLRDNPAGVLAQYGLHPPSNLKIIILFDTEAERHVVADPRWAEQYGNDVMNRITEEPGTGLKLVGMDIREGIDYKVVINTHDRFNIVIPCKPSHYECSIEYLR